jgi:NodT family efflux transporter outer membrane factor (OMF) lipoprotein
MPNQPELPAFSQRLRPLGLRGLVSLLALAASFGVADAKGMPRAAPKPMDSYAMAATFAAPERDWPSDCWWEAYRDPQLSLLIKEALANSPDLKAAQARVRKARAVAVQAGAALLPSVSAGTVAGGGALNSNGGFPGGGSGFGAAGLVFDWEIDFWGKNRASLRAARSDAEAAQAEGAAARLTLSSEIASAYADLAALYADRDATTDAVAVRRQTETLMQGRVARGLENDGAARRAQSARAATEAELAHIDESIGLTKIRIAALLGDGPDRALAVERPAISALASFGLPSDLRADLIGRRPDVIAARWRVDAAAKRIKVARAAFYPNVNLMGLLGVQTFGLSNLLRSGATTGGGAAAISLPIFTGGRLTGQLHGAEADYDEAVADYDRTVTQALADVADAATSSRALSTRLVTTEEAETAATAAWQVASNRYRGGLATYLDVLTAEDAMISAQRATADLKTRAFTLDVELVHALGGGFQSSSPKA